MALRLFAMRATKTAMRRQSLNAPSYRRPGPIARHARAPIARHGVYQIPTAMLVCWMYLYV